MATTLIRPEAPTVAPFRWTVEAFDRLPDDLFPKGIHAELIDGQIYTPMGQGNAHIIAVQLVFRALYAAYGPDFNLSMGLPVTIGDNKPEPDVRVLRGKIEDYDGHDPDPAAEIALVVEVSQTSLNYDLGPKLAMYAAAGVPEYWILDLASRAMQVCRDPERDVYRDTVVFREGESVMANGAKIEIAALLPRA